MGSCSTIIINNYVLARSLVPCKGADEESGDLLLALLPPHARADEESGADLNAGAGLELFNPLVSLVVSHEARTRAS